MQGDHVENERERYNMARLTNKELDMLTELEHSMSNEKGEAIVLVAYEQEKNLK